MWPISEYHVLQTALSPKGCNLNWLEWCADTQGDDKEQKHTNSSALEERVDTPPQERLLISSIHGRNQVHALRKAISHSLRLGQRFWTLCWSLVSTSTPSTLQKREKSNSFWRKWATERGSLDFMSPFHFLSPLCFLAVSTTWPAASGFYHHPRLSHHDGLRPFLNWERIQTIPLLSCFLLDTQSQKQEK